MTALAVGRVCFIDTAHSCPRARRLSAFHPLSVILSLTIVTGVLHPLRSVFAVTSPARIKPVSDASENPCASIIVSVRPSGLPVRKASARYWSLVKRGMAASTRLDPGAASGARPRADSKLPVGSR